MKAHPFDAVSFIAGAFLLAIGLLVVGGDIAQRLGTWLAPAIIIGLGLILLVAGWNSSRGGSADASGEGS
jgi:hypothetical protein